MNPAKHILLALLAIQMSAAPMTTARADEPLDCEAAYQSAIKGRRVKAALSTTGGGGLTTAGVFAGYVGIIFAVFASDNAFAVVGTSVGGSVAGGGAALSGNGISKVVKAGQLKKAKNMLQQSKLGDGVDLQEYVAELNEETAGHFTASEVATIVLEANTDGTLCPADIGPEGMKELDLRIRNALGVVQKQPNDES
ncbi:MAG: hypothetical protein AAB425_07425 [Bdellovibrionota bacterium]